MAPEVAELASKTVLLDFQASIDKLATTNQAAVHVSQQNIGLEHTSRQRHALTVFSKLIVHNKAILRIFKKYMRNPKANLLDHFSAATLARASLEAALMTMYLSEPHLTRDQWNLRRQLLFLNDANNRSRFLKPLQKLTGEPSPFLGGSDELKNSVRTKIAQLAAQLGYTTDRVKSFQSGNNIFIDGVRGAIREAGWNVDDFDYHQSYLSAYVHSHPVSFLRAYEYNVQYRGASEFQVRFCQYINSLVSQYTSDTLLRMDIFSTPRSGDPNGHLE